MKKFKSFIAGFLTCVFLMGTFTVAFAAGDVDIKAILSSTIKMKLYGKDFIPQESNGTYLKPISYNNRTYLPVRVLAEALNIPIEWDGATNTIWIGGKTEVVPVSEAKMFDDDSSESILTIDTDKLTTSDSTYKWGITNNKPLNSEYFRCFLKPNGKYKHFKASLFLDSNAKKELVMEFRKSSGGKDREGTVMKSVTLKPGETQKIDIDIGGLPQIYVNSLIGSEVNKLVIGEPTFENGEEAQMIQVDAR